MKNDRFPIKQMRPITWILFFAVVLLTFGGPAAEAQQTPELTRGNDQVLQIEPVRPASSVALASGALRAAVERLDRGQTAGLGIDVVGSKIRVEVLHTLDSSEIRSVITDFGGTVEGEVEGILAILALLGFFPMLGGLILNESDPENQKGWDGPLEREALERSRRK